MWLHASFVLPYYGASQPLATALGFNSRASDNRLGTDYLPNQSCSRIYWPTDSDSGIRLMSSLGLMSLREILILNLFRYLRRKGGTAPACALQLDTPAARNS
jgi:hypothetical protein